MYDEWMRLFPNVTPFYAVKCNSDPVFVKVLAELGAGFDCASKVTVMYRAEFGWHVYGEVYLPSFGTHSLPANGKFT